MADPWLKGLRGSQSAPNLEKKQRRGKSPGPGGSKTPRGKGSGRKGSRKKGKEKSTVHVAVRVRPLSKHEKSVDSWETVEVSNKQLICLRDPKDKTMFDDPLQRSRETRYAFDVALPPGVTNSEVYEASAKDVVTKVMAGQHGTIFAYGATGSGKTYTMSGTKDNPGVMVFVIRDLFNSIQAEIKEHESDSTAFRIDVTASYLEIYNENLRDLLTEDRVPIDLREDPIKGVTVAGITEYPMTTANEVFRILDEGAKHRTTDSHKLNEASSRSHAVLVISVEHFYGENLFKSANLTMIDLAGSERAKKVGTNQKMLREGANINRSLLALANCINALGQSKKKGLYIPYRDSKLTRLLKDSLGGWAHTVMIANVSCASSQFDETRETLLYANRAKNIKVTEDMLAIRQATATKMMKKQNMTRMMTDLTKELGTLKKALDPRRLSLMQEQFEAEEKNGSDPLAKELPLPPGVEAHLKRMGLDKKQSNNNSNSNSSKSSKEPLPQLRKRRQSIAEQKISDELLTSIVNNFQDIVQLRRSIVEVEETDEQNKAELREIELILIEWGNLGHNNTLPREVMEFHEMKESINESLAENAKYKQELRERLANVEQVGVNLRESITMVRLRKERQQILNLTLERCILELQKMELELESRSFQNELADARLEVDYYRKLIRKNGITHSGFARYKFLNSNNVALPELPAAPDMGAVQVENMTQEELQATLALPNGPRASVSYNGNQPPPVLRSPGFRPSVSSVHSDSPEPSMIRHQRSISTELRPRKQLEVHSRKKVAKLLGVSEDDLDNMKDEAASRPRSNASSNASLMRLPISSSHRLSLVEENAQNEVEKVQEEFEKKVAELEARVTAAVEQREIASAERDSYERQLQESKSRQHRLEEDVELLSQQLNEIASLDLGDAEALLAEHVLKNARLEETVAKLQYDAAHNDLKNERQRRASVKSERAAVDEAELMKLASELHEKDDLLDELKSQVDSMEMALYEAHEAKGGLADELQALQHDNKQLDKKNSSLEAKVTELEGRLKKANGRKSKAAAKSSMADKRRIRELERRNNELEARFDAKQAELNRVESKATRLESEISRTRAEVERTREVFNQEELARMEAEREKAALQEQLRIIKEEQLRDEAAVGASLKETQALYDAWSEDGQSYRDDKESEAKWNRTINSPKNIQSSHFFAGADRVPDKDLMKGAPGGVEAGADAEQPLSVGDELADMMQRYNLQFYSSIIGLPVGASGHHKRNSSLGFGVRKGKHHHNGDDWEPVKKSAALPTVAALPARKSSKNRGSNAAAADVKNHSDQEAKHASADLDERPINAGKKASARPQRTMSARKAVPKPVRLDFDMKPVKSNASNPAADSPLLDLTRVTSLSGLSSSDLASGSPPRKLSRRQSFSKRSNSQLNLLLDDNKDRVLPRSSSRADVADERPLPTSRNNAADDRPLPTSKRTSSRADERPLPTHAKKKSGGHRRQVSWASDDKQGEAARAIARASEPGSAEPGEEIPARRSHKSSARAPQAPVADVSPGEAGVEPGEPGEEALALSRSNSKRLHQRRPSMKTAHRASKVASLLQRHEPGSIAFDLETDLVAQALMLNRELAGLNKELDQLSHN